MAAIMAATLALLWPVAAQQADQPAQQSKDQQEAGKPAGLFADGKPYYKRLPKAGQPFQSWGSAGPVGVELR
jgi:hypothetical protein